MALKGLVSADSERARIDREEKKIDKDVAALEKKLSSPGFVDRAPKEVVDEAQAQRAALLDARARLQAARKLVDEL
jgi:valyl-tRNA synthetase